MKLRIRGNSIRLRLTQSEVGQLGETGLVENSIDFGGENRLLYVLRTEPETDSIGAGLSERKITVGIPADKVFEWVNSDLVGLESRQEIGSGETLHILIEKDFACLTPRAEGEDEDTFPHPLGKEKC